jgi:glucan-binding YG repeat protein
VHYGADGAMQFGMVKIGTSWYYFNINNGDQLKSSEINVSGKWYYFNAVGTRVTNSWWTLGTRTVYYADDGMLFGSHSIGGVWYNFDLNNGARL